MTHEIRLSRKMPDGATYRDHMLAAEAAGVSTGELEPRPIPSDADQIYRAFWELRRSAGGNGMAPNAISYPHVESWQRVYGVRLQPFEVELLFVMDRAALTAYAENAKTSQPQRPKP